MNDPSAHVQRFWTSANLITLSRAILSVPVVWAIVQGDGSSWAALILFVIAAATDGLDGYVARSRGEISRFGTLLDPIADKVFGLLVFISLVWVDALPISLFYILALKELMLLVGGAVLLRGADRVVSARSLGKIATVVLFIGFGGILAGMSTLGTWLASLGVALSVAAGIDYAVLAWRSALSARNAR